jgi:putative membrane protein
MLRRLIALSAITAGALMGGTAAHAATTPDVNEQDRTFLTVAHQSNLAEIKAGTAAQKQATTQAVKDVGATLIREHKMLDDQVGKVANQVGVTLPDAPSAKQQAELKKVAAKSGAAFDRAWVASQIAGHKEDLAAGAQEIANGSSEQVKQLARDAKPVVQGHLTQLQNIQSGKGG